MKSGAQARRTGYQSWILSIAAASLLLWLGACSSQPAQEQSQSESAPAAGGPERHPLRGTVISVDPGGNSLVVDHEEIPNFMGAMTMPYTVRDEGELEDLEAGDEVNAEVVVDDSGMYLENIVVSGEGQ